MQIAQARDLPVLGAACGGSGTMVFDHDTPMDWVQRPPQLANVGDSMPPAYDPGDIIYIHPSMAVKSGLAVLAVLVDLHDGSALVKTLIKQTEPYVRTPGYKPKPRQFEIKRRKIKATVPVTGKWDRT